MRWQGCRHGRPACWRAESAGDAGGGSGVDGAVAAFAFLEVEEGFEETGAVEVGPEGFGDEDFGVGDLPEEEIADAHFAAGANQEIGIGKIGCVEMAGEIFFSDGRKRPRSGGRLTDWPI